MRNDHSDFAASRAYYAMFYVAQALLAHLGQAYSKRAAVIAAFGREYAKTRRLDAKYHQWLITAQNLRNTGDYGIDAHVSQRDAETACCTSHERTESQPRSASFAHREAHGKLLFLRREQGQHHQGQRPGTILPTPTGAIDQLCYLTGTELPNPGTAPVPYLDRPDEETPQRFLQSDVQDTH